MCGSALGGKRTGGVMYTYLTYNSLGFSTYGTLIGCESFHQAVLPHQSQLLLKPRVLQRFIPLFRFRATYATRKRRTFSYRKTLGSYPECHRIGSS
jgi:hypothetical protein